MRVEGQELPFPLSPLVYVRFWHERPLHVRFSSSMTVSESDRSFPSPFISETRQKGGCLPRKKRVKLVLVTLSLELSILSVLTNGLVYHLVFSNFFIEVTIYIFFWSCQYLRHLFIKGPWKKIRDSLCTGETFLMYMKNKTVFEKVKKNRMKESLINCKLR